MRKLYILTFLILLLPFVANAEEVEINGINYNLIPKAKAAEVVKKSSGEYEGDITIPSKVTYEETVYDVTEIREEAFQSCKNLKSITIPNSVTNIGNGAFRRCSGLTSIEIPNSVTSIGYQVFYICSSLTSLKIPNSVTSIGFQAFCYCSSLNSVMIPNSVTSIEDWAFAYCTNLSSIMIPNSVTNIEKHAFEGCSSLSKVNIVDLEAWCKISFFNSNSNPLSLAQHLFLNDVEIKDLIIPNSVTSISDYAFYNCSSFTSIKIPNSVTSIGDDTFRNCYGLTSIEIPNSVTSIGAQAFSGCSSLTSIIIGKSVKKIYSVAFEKCKNLTDVTCLAKEVPKTNSNAFNESYIEYATLHVPEGSVAAYKAAEPWSGFKSIVSVAETKYTLTYQLDGEEYKTYQLAEGDPITPEPAPTKDGYTFLGWSTIPATMPAENLTITGKFEKITSEDVIKIGESGKLWYCSKYDLDFTNNEDLKAYTATGFDTQSNSLWLSRVLDVPAGTGIMLKGAEGEYKVKHTTGHSYYTNMFKGDAYKDMQVSKTDGDYTNFYLNKSGQIVPFPNESVNYPAGRCYLQIPTSLLADPANTRSINYVFDDESDATGISSTPATPTNTPDVYYNLQGQCVDTPTKGLYIKNGKKVIIR